MDDRARQWLRWVGKLYHEILSSEEPADSVVSNRMRVEGKRWGHDARRWVSATVYALVRLRVRTLWFWGAGLREYAPLREIALGLRGGEAATPAEGSPEFQGSGEQGPEVGPLNVARAAELSLLPERYREVPREAPGGRAFAVAEAAVGWVARPPGSSLDQLAKAIEEWLAPADPKEVLEILSEGAEAKADPALFPVLLEWNERCRSTPPVDGSGPEEAAWSHAVPLWLAARWCDVLGRDETMKLTGVFEAPAPIYLRSNSLVSTEEEGIRRLRAEGYYVAAAGEVPGAMMVVHRANLYRSQAFAEGLYEVQDLSSQVVSLALDPKPGERVLDYCSGAGGKTLHLAALMQNKGLLWALDVDARRLLRLRVRAARCHVFNVRRGLLEPFTDEQVKEAWARCAKVRVEESGRRYAAADAPGVRSAIEVPATPSPPGQENAGGPALRIPEEMRAALGLDAPDPGEAVRPGPAGGSAPAWKRRDPRATELPEPNEADKQELREALAYMPAEFDAVLVDAPCSGTGVCRRRPDFGWRLTQGVLEEQMREQAVILRAAARYVRPGGRLLYATCSLLPEENENQVLSFLSDHPDFEPGDLSESLGRHGLGGWVTRENALWLELLPSRRPGDGFFMALLHRRNAKVT